jgi:hypothetical protein
LFWSSSSFLPLADTADGSDMEFIQGVSVCRVSVYHLLPIHSLLSLKLVVAASCWRGNHRHVGKACVTASFIIIIITIIIVHTKSCHETFMSLLPCCKTLVSVSDMYNKCVCLRKRENSFWHSDKLGSAMSSLHVNANANPTLQLSTTAPFFSILYHSPTTTDITSTQKDAHAGARTQDLLGSCISHKL